MRSHKIVIPKELLQQLYVRDNLTPHKIAEKFGCSFKTVRNRLKEYGIPFKDPSYARSRYFKSDFNGSINDKAYILGFRLGDLNVYRVSAKSKTIVVRCHTTQQYQVSVVESLFGKFGKVSVSLNNGHFHVNCFLNNSFLFLFNKNLSSWRWIQKAKELTALSFIAGYTDAEGNILINQGRARFKIDSYDSDILQWISQWLTKKKIDNKLRIIYKKGEKVSNQSPFPKYLWRLNINQMNSLELFLTKITPLLKHERRIAQAKESLSNVLKRKNR